MMVVQCFSDYSVVYCCEVGVYVMFCNGVCCVSCVIECGLGVGLCIVVCVVDVMDVVFFFLLICEACSLRCF